ncbi:hypothetical protein B9Z55_006687 [Caenorhabditis nigoni]|uniref:Uncharacterized protein n=1 Tax=Caenorhabditis nigoni TaxID=1611254 RepID=A0A2G5V6J9_9PELO|nr:hypothetical protein B9Z55_006687 [Caenorhabditis nigoni]
MKGNTWTSGPISRASRTVRRDDIGTIQIRTTGAEEQKERGSLDFGTNFGDFEDGFQGRLQNWHGSNQDGRKGRDPNVTGEEISSRRRDARTL